ncbi:MAG TPA: class GN sortase [Marinobacter sp.]|uniref:class GN sortase n=1 Tax=Marinobacter sp. TaxID=50741 RepID=UPI002D7F8658|nr:class GN sortase [Marinobacter sp.]HET8800510.1 class GN sortase [Marinobacter sp.]
MNRLLALLLTSSATLLVFGLWIPLKAVLAQELLAMAWAESQARQVDTRPWPWADTWPVARLALPGLNESMIVLAGTHGESLAFGPGLLTGGEDRQAAVIIAGHRDTHFRALRNLRSGSPLQLQGRDGQWQHYQVWATRVVDSRVAMIDTRNLADGTLLLVTCYPFDSIDAGGPLRYVVEARLETPASPARRVEQIDTVAGL